VKEASSQLKGAAKNGEGWGVGEIETVERSCKLLLCGEHWPRGNSLTLCAYRVGSPVDRVRKSKGKEDGGGGGSGTGGLGSRSERKRTLLLGRWDFIREVRDRE